MGYGVQKVILTSNSQVVNFSLKSTAIQLPNVTVQNPKPFLKYRADTLSYNVDSFTQKQDRTIGDVLRKMPGIDVDANGKISYNGKAISNFYVDGDNLLDDKYNIATNSIAADMVKDVQVLENHQPIKVLKDVTVSNKVAINLSLKNKAKLKVSTRAEVGAGYANELAYDANLTTMAFKNKYKAINSFKINNIGKDLANDIISHNIADFFKALENNVPYDMLNLNKPDNPNIGINRYLFNNAALVNANNLFKTKNDVQIKVNTYFLYDRQLQNFDFNSFFYLPTDTIKYIQNLQTNAKSNLFRTQVNINSNKDKSYLNNTLVVEYNRLPSNSSTILNTSTSYQNLLQQTTKFSNEINFIQTTKRKKIVEFYSYISYLNKPENLLISPGINENFFNNNIGYKELKQNLNIPTYFTNNSVSFKSGKGRVLKSYKLGFSGCWQQLQSNTLVKQNSNLVNNVSDSFINKLLWQQQKVFANINYDYLGDRIKLSLFVPANWLIMGYNNTAVKNNPTAQLNRLFVNPSFNIKYALGQESFINSSYMYNNSFATVQDVNAHYILANFNQLLISDVAFKQGTFHSATINFNYRKTIKIFFFNLGLAYNSTNNNSIINTQFAPSLQIQRSELFDNSINSFTLFTGVSKYLFKLRTTVNLKANVRVSDWMQLQNSSPTSFVNNSYSISSSITPKISEWLNMGYFLNYLLSESRAKYKNFGKQFVIQMQHVLEANVFVNKDFYFKLKGEDFYLKTMNRAANNYFFADASLTYKLNKLKTDFVFDIQNIANTKTYTLFNINANNYTESVYAIRPRMLNIKAFFNF